jgi:hypothetical protein
MQGESVSTQAGHLRFAQSQNDGTRDCCVHCVSTARQRVDGNFCGQRMRGRAHAVRGKHRGSTGKLKITHIGPLVRQVSAEAMMAMQGCQGPFRVPSRGRGMTSTEMTCFGGCHPAVEGSYVELRVDCRFASGPGWDPTTAAKRSIMVYFATILPIWQGDPGLETPAVWG